MNSQRPFRRPVQMASLDNLRSELDPAAQAELAHMTAQILISRGRENTDPEVVQRLVRLADEMGLEVIAEMWSNAPAVSLPGALWRLYVLREWVQRDAEGAAYEFRAGQGVDQVALVLAGVASPPGPDEVKALADQVLRGIYTGDFAVALERAAAFCRIVGVGRTFLADSTDVTEPRLADAARADAGSRGASSRADAVGRVRGNLTRSAASLIATAETFEHCAAAFRNHTLD